MLFAFGGNAIAITSLKPHQQLADSFPTTWIFDLSKIHPEQPGGFFVGRGTNISMVLDSDSNLIQAKTPFITLPWTSVRRRSMPLWYQLSRS